MPRSRFFFLPSTTMTLLLFGAAFTTGTCSSKAQADDRPDRGAFDLRVGGSELGSVRSVPGGDPEKTITIAVSDITPALVSELRSFYEGKTSQKSLSLTSGAVVKRANEARLASVKLPAVGAGAGGSAEIDLAFDVGSIKTSPSLHVASDKRRTTPPKIAGFHLRVEGLNANVTRLDAITVKQIVGSSTLPPVSFSIDSADASSFQTWAKTKNARRDTSIEYTDDKGSALLKVVLQGCTSQVTPNGPIMQVAVTCSKIKAS
jgi:hypothetical protein